MPRHGPAVVEKRTQTVRFIPLWAEGCLCTESDAATLKRSRNEGEVCQEKTRHTGKGHTSANRLV